MAVATTTGMVEQITPAVAPEAAEAVAHVRITPPGQPSQDFKISTDPADGVAARAGKQGLVTVLQQAEQAGWPVTVTHEAEETELQTVTLGGFDIKPVGSTIQGDFFTVTGNNIPPNVSVVFEVGPNTVQFSPHVVRPDWIFVAQFPHAIAPGRYSMWLATQDWSSDAVPVDVTAASQATIRVLNPGARTAMPFTVAFVANPSYIPRPAPPSGTKPDPAIASRPPFHGAVRFCLKNLLEPTEDIIARFDPDVRFLALFDPVAPSDPTALLEEHPTESTILVPRRQTIRTFLSDRGLAADIVFVLHGSPTYYRASAIATTDDGLDGVSFSYDDFTGTHGFGCSVPGTVAFPMGSAKGPIALHEFCHAAAETQNGVVIDLYSDRDLPAFSGTLRVNKKWRHLSTEPVPADFADYEGETYQADPRRDGLAYGPGWRSYHPAPTDGNRPNLMDTYGLVEDSMACRLDQLTRAWLLDRLRAKLSR